MLGGPFCENSARSAFETPTLEMTAANSAGRSVSARPTVIPPAEPPCTASRDGVVQPSRTSASQQSMRSRQVLGLESFWPAFHQRRPYSPPPRTCAVAITPPCSRNAIARELKNGEFKIWYEPYASTRAG